MTTHTATIHGYRPPQPAGPSPGVALAAAACWVLLLCAPSAAAAATRWVNEDSANYLAPGSSCKRPGYATIQAAVTAASAGDVIKVCPGKYLENVSVGTGHLAIQSTAGAAATMVKAAASTYVFVVSAPGVTVRGFTLIPAGVADDDIGVHVAIEGATGLKILENVIFSGRLGVNLGCASVGSVVAHNTLTRQTEAGINIDTCEAPPFPGSRDNFIHHNIVCSTAAAGSIALGGSSDDNRIEYNVATTISVSGSGNVVRYTTTQAAIVDSGSGTTLNNNLVDAGVCPPAP